MASPLVALPVVPAWRALIDQALHAVMLRQSEQAEQSLAEVGRCAEYAIVGARVLSLLTGAVFEPVSGGEILDCGGGRYLVLFPDRPSRRRARSLCELKEFHCWIEASHRLDDGRCRREVIDFTCRHDARVAAMYGVPYARAASPDYLWGWADEQTPIPADLRAKLPPDRQLWMWRDPKCCALLGQYEARHAGLFGLLTQQVLDTLADLAEVAEVAEVGDCAPVGGGSS